MNLISQSTGPHLFWGEMRDMGGSRLGWICLDESLEVGQLRSTADLKNPLKRVYRTSNDQRSPTRELRPCAKLSWMFFSVPYKAGSSVAQVLFTLLRDKSLCRNSGDPSLSIEHFLKLGTRQRGYLILRTTGPR